MREDSGVECCPDCAVERRRRLREETIAREYRGGRAEEVGNGVFSSYSPISGISNKLWVRINVQFCVQTPRTKPPDQSASDDNCHGILTRT
jgi:hypothetical protein